MAQDSNKMERAIISILLAALAAVLWYLLLDTRQDMSTLRDMVMKNQIRLTTTEEQMKNTISDLKDLRQKADRLEIRTSK